MATTRAYALKEAYEAEDFAGSCALGSEGDTLDIKQALEDGGGVIATQDPQVIRALDDYPALRSVAAAEAEGAQLVGEQPEEAPATDPSDYTRDELDALARDAGVEDPEALGSKREVAEAIDAANQGEEG